MHPDILAEKEKVKMESNDRILVLEPIDAKGPISVYGAVDQRLFKGGNKLHVIRDLEGYMWTFKYEHGMLPDPLKQKFTKFNLILKHAQDYFGKRNLKITEVIDAP